MNKKSITAVTLVIVVLLSIVLTGCGAKSSVSAVPSLDIPSTGSTMPKIEYSVELSNADVPDRAKIYKFTDVSIHPDLDLQHIANLFGFSDETKVESYDDFIIMADEKLMVDYEVLTGAWSLRDTSYDSHKKHELLSDKESVEIARNFLIENDLYNERFSIVTVVTQYSGSMLDTTYAPYSKSVYFYPQIDDYNILGVSRIVVNVGEGGQIIGVMNYYKDFELYGEIELTPPLEFIEGIKTNQYSSSISTDAISASIIDVKLAYWEDAGSREEQPYLQPVWVFLGESIQPDGTKSSFDVIVQAAKNVETPSSILPEEKSQTNTDYGVPTPTPNTN